MQYVYHCSEIGGLTEIEPRKSTHGKDYVYASKYISISALFLARWNDFLLTLMTDLSNNDLKIKLVERYPKAIEEIFKDKSGYIYFLDHSNFIQNTNWECEVISSKQEVVREQLLVNDVFSLIKSFEEQGEVEIFYYPNRPSSIPVDDSDMIKKAIELYEMSGNSYNIDYCIERFPHLKKKLINEINNFR